ncbi:MAG: hypothetical protein PHN88_15865 [Ignavibacteria bacterium]|nr:hypothetical protein [Ignavibacteria bacterium]
MRGIIDYAGMYPPANLNLADAFRNYCNYLVSQDEWMISRFVCSLNSFENIFKGGSAALKMVEDFDFGRWISFSILLNQEPKVKDFLISFRKDLEKVKKISEEYPGKVVADTFEFKLPAELNGKFGTHAVKKMLEEINDVLTWSGLLGARIFVEPPIDNNYNSVFRKLAEASADSNHKGSRAGLKLRTGGITQESFPSVEQIASALDACKQNKIPFKATAGLHHPVRHQNENAGLKMHGFFNVFGAGILHFANSLSENELRNIVMDENGSAFGFTNDIFSWNDITADKTMVEKARNEFVISFGSCSFDEPREDLNKMGYEF